jgi:hypothetical protein
MIERYSYWNEYFGYRFSLSTVVTGKTPLWLTHEDFPPLSPRIAIANSRSFVQQLLREVPPFEPTLSACSLVCAEGQDGTWWYYLVSWFVPDMEDPAADWTEFPVPVVFDGSTPEPLKFRYEDRFNVYR